MQKSLTTPLCISAGGRWDLEVQGHGMRNSAHWDPCKSEGAKLLFWMSGLQNSIIVPFSGWMQSLILDSSNLLQFYFIDQELEVFLLFIADQKSYFFNMVL